MAESYDIHLTDPLAPAFKVQAFTSNGPNFPTGTAPDATATSISTSLLIYGKGHANYGERIAENILHVMENFSGSTVPQYPVSGQLWYARYTLLKVVASYYKWDDDTSLWVEFTPLTGGVAPTVVVGSYWYDGSDLHYGVGSAHPLGEGGDTWVLRVHDDIPGLGIPTIARPPRKVLKVYDGSAWVDQNTVYVSNTIGEPPTPVIGDLWLDATTGRFNYYNGSAFQSVALESDLAPLVAPYLPLAGGIMSGDLNMDANSITNVATPTQGVFPADDLKAANKIFVDAAITAALGGSVPVNLDDLSDVNVPTPTLNDFLYWTSTEWASKVLTLTDISDMPAGVDSTQLSYLIGVTSAIQTQLNGKLSDSGDTMTGAYNSTGTFTIDGTLILGAAGIMDLDGHPIINVQNPSNPQDAATMDYVDTEITNIASADQYVNTGIIYPTAGATGRLPEANAVANDLELVYNDNTNLLINNIAAGDHVHIAADVTYTPTPETILSELTVVPTNVADAIDQLDQIVVKRTTNRRNIVIATAAQTTVGVVEYAAGTDTLFIYVQGLKQVSSIAGNEYAQFTLPPTNTSTSGLANDATTYTAAVVVDGGASQPISIVGSASQTFADVVTEIQADITGALVVLVDGELRIISDTYGAGSTIAITDTDLFSSLTNFSSIDSTGATGVTYDYNEQAGHKQLAGTIIFNAGLTVSDRVEAISLGDADLGII